MWSFTQFLNSLKAIKELFTSREVVKQPPHSELSSNTSTNLELMTGRVFYILTNHPLARDNKEFFFSLVRKEFGGFSPSMAENYSRTWRLIQRNHPDLRGEKFYLRQSHSRKASRIYAQY